MGYDPETTEHISTKSLIYTAEIASSCAYSETTKKKLLRLSMVLMSILRKGL